MIDHDRPRVPVFRDWMFVFGTGVAIRAAFMWFKGSWSYSWDLKIWKDVVGLIGDGRDVYRETPFFVWPPVWIQILKALSGIAVWTGLSITTVVPVFLIAVEGVLVAVLLKELGDHGSRRPAALLVAGIAANPVCVILVTQHGNFDVLVGLVVLLCIRSLVRFQSSRLSDDWLFACFWLGMGIGLKTVPMLLLPLLLAGARSLGPRVRFLGGVLALGPTLYGLGLLHSLGVADIWTRVFGYRSSSTWFGAPGWFWRIGRGGWVVGYSRLFTGVILVGCAALAAAAWRGRIGTPRRLFASAGFLLAAVPAFGPGYGPQYFYWFWPLVLVSFALGSRAFRGVVVGFGAVAAATYLVEYALAPMLGSFLWMRFPSTRNLVFSEFPGALREFTLARTPLWLAYFALLAALVVELRRPERSVEDSGELPRVAAGDLGPAPAGG